MEYYKLQNGASPSQPSNGGGSFWETIGNIFEGIGNINFLSPNQNYNFNPINYPYQNETNQNSNNVVLIISGILLFALILKKLT